MIRVCKITDTWQSPPAPVTRIAYIRPLTGRCAYSDASESLYGEHHDALRFFSSKLQLLPISDAPQSPNAFLSTKFLPTKHLPQTSPYRYLRIQPCPVPASGSFPVYLEISPAPSPDRQSVISHLYHVLCFCVSAGSAPC